MRPVTSKKVVCFVNWEMRESGIDRATASSISADAATVFPKVSDHTDNGLMSTVIAPLGRLSQRARGKDKKYLTKFLRLKLLHSSAVRWHHFRCASDMDGSNGHDSQLPCTNSL